SRNLRSAKRAVGQQAAVFSGDWHPLGHALINDIHADLRQPIDVRFARAEVAPFDGVVEEPMEAVAVVLIILGGIDAALGGDAVGTAWAVLEAEAFDLVAQFRQQ